MTDLDDIEIQQRLENIADALIVTIQENGAEDSYEAIAALAIAMCAIARADDLPMRTITEALSIANQQIKEAIANDLITLRGRPQ